MTDVFVLVREEDGPGDTRRVIGVADSKDAARRLRRSYCKKPYLDKDKFHVGNSGRSLDLDRIAIEKFPVFEGGD